MERPSWQGWLYLAVVMDLFSRKMMGWSVGPTIHPELLLDAVLMAIRRRLPVAPGPAILCGENARRPPGARTRGISP